MYYVYILESEDHLHWYFGMTNDITRRLEEHNAGKSIHTNKHKPWIIRLAVTFRDQKQAREFEKYLKSHSGRACMKKHFHVYSQAT